MSLFCDEQSEWVCLALIEVTNKNHGLLKLCGGCDLSERILPYKTMF